MGPELTSRDVRAYRAVLLDRVAGGGAPGVAADLLKPRQ
jgi:hypothetical protein